jgi:hypothetical protein
MRTTSLILACAAAAATLTVPALDSAQAGYCPPAAYTHRVKHKVWKRPAAVAYRCPRCCDTPRAAPPAYYGYGAPPAYYAVPAPVFVPAYTPGIVYQGPFGIYRAYNPVVVYDVPLDIPYYSSWRAERRWFGRW